MSKTTYEKNKIIDLTQNKRSSWYYYYTKHIISYTTATDDIITFATAKKITHSTPFIFKGLTKYMNETNAIRMVQITMNFAVIAYQWLNPTTSTWFSYFLSSSSGLKKIYQCILKNPIYGLLFFCTFYLKLLEGTSDEKHFDMVATTLHLPKHADLGAESTIDSIINNLPEVLIGADIHGYKINTKKLLKVMISLISSIGLQIAFEKILIGSLKQTNPQISTMSNQAVYISDRDSFHFDDLDIQEQLDFLEDEEDNIKKYVKKHTNPKKKQYKKRMFMEIKQIKAPTGETICLDKCDYKVKTRMGCYCESDCGKSTFFRGKKWCWVDPKKCKRGKYLDKYKGYAYDYCDNKLTSTKKCFDGYKYTDCNIK